MPQYPTTASIKDELDGLAGFCDTSRPFSKEITGRASQNMRRDRRHNLASVVRRAVLIALAATVVVSSAAAADWDWNLFRRKNADTNGASGAKKSKLRQVRPIEEKRVSLIGGQPMRAKVHEYPESNSKPSQKKNRWLGAKRTAKPPQEKAASSAPRGSTNSRFVMSGQPQAGGSTFGDPNQPKQSWWKKVFSTHVETTSRPVGVR